jgi:hypothetical protein
VNNEAYYQMELALQELMKMMLNLVQVVVAIQKSLAPTEDEDAYYGAGNYDTVAEQIALGEGE